MVLAGGGFTSGCPLCKQRVFDLLESTDLADEQFRNAFTERVLKVRQEHEEHARQRYELELQAAQQIRQSRRGRTITRGHLHLVRCEDATS